jgi:hypothetical protein
MRRSHRPPPETAFFYGQRCARSHHTSRVADRTCSARSRAAKSSTKNSHVCFDLVVEWQNHPSNARITTGVFLHRRPLIFPMPVHDYLYLVACVDYSLFLSRLPGTVWNSAGLRAGRLRRSGQVSSIGPQAELEYAILGFTALSHRR